MACCGKPKADDGARAVDGRTAAMLAKHGWAFTRIAQLCVPKVARATGAPTDAAHRRCAPTLRTDALTLSPACQSRGCWRA